MSSVTILKRKPSSNSLQTNNSSNVPDQNEYFGPETLSVRFTPKAINDLMGMSIDYVNEPHWQVITHFIYHCLDVKMNGDVVIHTPLMMRDTEDCENIGETTINNPATYFPVIENLVERNPQMNVAFSFPQCEDNLYLKRILQKFPLQILTCLKKIVTENKFVNLIEIDAVAFNLLLSENSHWVFFSEIPVKWMVTLSNSCSVSDSIVSKITKLQSFRLLDSVIIKSFGFLRVARCPTSHGTYQSMMLHPESSLEDFKLVFKDVCKWLNPIFIIMDIDTCGVEYLRSKTHGAYVDKFRLLTLKEIKHLRDFGMKTYYENYDADNGCSMLEFLHDGCAISYDNNQVRSQKIDFILDNKLKGIVIGELQNDLPPNHPQSLFATYMSKIINRGFPSTIA